MEAYCKGIDVKYSGTNNERHENASGIRVEVKMRRDYYDLYNEQVKKNQIRDIPIEYYSVSYNYFNGEPVEYRFSPIKSVMIDTTRKDYAYVIDQFVSDNISSYLSDQQQIDLSSAYRQFRNNFRNNDIIKSLNNSVIGIGKIDNRQLSIELKEDGVAAWKKDMSINVENIPFEHIGFGTQNMIKMELAFKNFENKINVLLLEEPENNLSYTNMARLVNYIKEENGKQVFISTHSSYVANKLDLSNLFLMNKGKVTKFSQLPKETISYFRKLPGYNTLRMILAEKIALVEGPTDELILQRAYLDKFGKIPIENGIDIIAVGSLAFKRYCDIAILLNKNAVIITDNDGDKETNIFEKYKEYLSHDNLKFVYEKDNKLHTIEPSVLEVNSISDTDFSNFKNVISKNGSNAKKSKEEVLEFMLKNKSEWSMRVYDSDEKINYPEYIENAIKELN